MLILTRRVGECLMIGDEVSVTVLGVRGTQVRLGVNAPRDVAVHRQEIYDRIRNEMAGDNNPSSLGSSDSNADALDSASSEEHSAASSSYEEDEKPY